MKTNKDLLQDEKAKTGLRNEEFSRFFMSEKTVGARSFFHGQNKSADTQGNRSRWSHVYAQKYAFKQEI